VRAKKRLVVAREGQVGGQVVVEAALREEPQERRDI